MSDPGKIEDLSFEDFKNQNGITYWWASEFMLMLGYDDMKVFERVIKKATRAFLSLDISYYDNIIPVNRTKNGEDFRDFKLTRFACYLIAMNSDPKRPEVAYIQAYFAQQTRKMELFIQGNEDLERVLIRDEIKEGNKSLNSVANQAGVVDFAKFTNAGYRGMYNMMNFQLAKRRNCQKEKLFETMGRMELAANLFRITQTEERIKSKNIKGQEMLEKTHFDVGHEVREIIIKNTGQRPESLPQEQQIPEIKKALKAGFRQMKKIDKEK